ncbi:hypothetical protein QO010_000272 [Caulobacter ginsengisoli]|uniref:Uncharacterized protein n=1 Tax=Caulobacter ginsengisoli TaxID=400775 RepID=A0ABU0IND9_9CAUL|nr:hypothetical protein [Caulobacter ginsengisoli]MDQ0462524.1 hypothetical protein [Caulobacter ginsengisoli]
MDHIALSPAFESDLDEVFAFAQAPEGEADDHRVMEVLERFRAGYEALSAAAARSPTVAEKLAELDSHIRDVAERRETERHANDMSHPPGQDGVGPLLGWDVRGA